MSRAYSKKVVLGMRDVGRESQGQTSQVGEKWKMALGMKESLTVLGNTKTGPR